VQLEGAEVRSDGDDKGFWRDAVRKQGHHLRAFFAKRSPGIVLDARRALAAAAPPEQD
jgi:hypothetical protein